MPFSYVQYPGAAGVGPFSLGFPYQLRADIKVYRDLDLVTGSYAALLSEGAGYTWPTTTQIQLTAAISGTLTIRRETPIASRRVDWTNGSSLTEEPLDTADLQHFYALQELADKAEIALARAARAPAVLAASVSAAGQSAVDILAVPDWATMVRVALNGVSGPAGVSPLLLRLGTSAGVAATGYSSAGFVSTPSVSSVSDATGFYIGTGNGALASNATVLLTRMSGNTWACASTAQEGTTAQTVQNGIISLSGVLTRVRLTHLSGGTFDAGTVTAYAE